MLVMKLRWCERRRTKIEKMRMSHGVVYPALRQALKRINKFRLMLQPWNQRIRRELHRVA